MFLWRKIEMIPYPQTQNIDWVISKVYFIFYYSEQNQFFNKVKPSRPNININKN